MGVTLNFRTILSEKITFEIDPNATIADVKKYLSENYSFPLAKIKLLLKAKILPDDKVVSTIPLEKDSVIVVHTLCFKDPLNNQNSSAFHAQPPQMNVPLQPPPANFAHLHRPVHNGAEVIQPSQSGEILIQGLQEMGYSRSQCEHAMIAANYDVNYAGELLLQGKIPDTTPLGQKSSSRVETQPGNKYSVNNNNNNPIFNNNNLTVRDENENRFGEFQPLYDQLTQNQKDTVKRLLQLSDPASVIQMYIACGNDEASTAAILRGD